MVRIQGRTSGLEAEIYQLRFPANSNDFRAKGSTMTFDYSIPYLEPKRDLSRYYFPPHERRDVPVNDNTTLYKKI